jgi:hypothetical protein
VHPKPAVSDGREKERQMTDPDRIAGVQVGGREPKALLLNDGSRLCLEEDTSPDGVPEWTRVGAEGGEEADITVSEAFRLAGDQHAEYVEVRTRAEIEWLRLIADWYREQADRLAGDLRVAATS